LVKGSNSAQHKLIDISFI